MTPMTTTHDRAKLQAEAFKELDKAKEALTNCVLLGITEREGNPMRSLDPILAARIEAAWAKALVTAIPRMLGSYA